MIKYKVIHAEGSTVYEASKKLENLVNDWNYDFGWKPQGGVSISVYYREDSLFGTTYTLTQAMIKEE